ncbi:hypothetical protein EDD15DRAFT_154527 [Pisolithus albus]|nr:hypothetical protein EDD15DRAFT_154527 [Pisolithus albus]
MLFALTSLMSLSECMALLHPAWHRVEDAHENQSTISDSNNHARATLWETLGKSKKQTLTEGQDVPGQESKAKRKMSTRKTIGKLHYPVSKHLTRFKWLAACVRRRISCLRPVVFWGRHYIKQEY